MPSGVRTATGQEQEEHLGAERGARGSRLAGRGRLLKEQAAGVRGAAVAASVRRQWVVRDAGCQFPSRPLGVVRAGASGEAGGG